MEDGLYRKIISEAATIGFRTLDIRNFGEPLIDKRLPDFVNLARQSGFGNIYIHTNGYGLNAEKLKTLVSNGMTLIIVSISPQREFIKTRPGINYERFKGNLDTLANSPYRDKVCVDHINTGISSSAEIEAMKAWLADLGIGLRAEIQLHNWASGIGDVLHARTLCHRLWSSFTVLADGKVALCCLDYEGDVVLGDVVLQRIDEIINGMRYQAVREAHLCGKFLPKCIQCDMPLVKDL
jgi:hypothetical protein